MKYITLPVGQLITFICILGLLGACREEQIEEKNSFRKKILLESEIDQLYLSRVNDNGFADGDGMGVYIVDYEGDEPGELANYGNRATNVRHTYHAADNKWIPDIDIYWKDSKTPVDIYGYYPYASLEEVRAYNFEVKENQSESSVKGEMGGYEASDFLWGKVEKVLPTDKVIRLPLHHRMSNARVTLKMGEGFSPDEWEGLEKSVLVKNTTRRSLIDLATGKVAAMGEAEETGTIPFRWEGEFRAIVVPQSVKAGKELFSITVGNSAYIFKKESDFTYEPGKMHNFTITVNKKSEGGEYEFKLADESISDWEADLASHESEMKEYIVIHVSEPGTLAECLKKENKDYAEIQNLKLTGKINKKDFDFMKDQMSRLQALNLKEVRITGVEDGGVSYQEDEIPKEAMRTKASLTRIILPDTLKVIGNDAFANTSLTGSLSIPENVTIIEVGAFNQCTNLTGFLSLPNKLQEIGNAAFSSCNFSGELKIPPYVTYIGLYAFNNNTNLSGKLELPSTLKTLGAEAFKGCKNLRGDIRIPQGIQSISYGTFKNTNFNGSLQLGNGVEYIEKEAFKSSNLKGVLILPPHLIIIEEQAFEGNDFSGELIFPKKLQSLGKGAFSSNYNLSGTLTFPKEITTIPSNCFYSCSKLEKLIFPENIESIQENAFNGCSNIQSIVCEALIPPYVMPGAFGGVPKDKFVLEVPEAALVAYQTAPGWSEFKRIGAHHELISYPSSIKALNKGRTQQITIEAEGEWEVTQLPSWCTLSAMSGSQKTELTLTIQDMPQGGDEVRTDSIIFKLKDKYYHTICSVSQYNYTHEEDEVITLQQASQGKGVNLVFVGDGYDAEEINNGTYLKEIKQQVAHFFGVEPYKSYRNYFNVYTAISLSQESGVSTPNKKRITKFETAYTPQSGLTCNTQTVFDYAMRMPGITEANLKECLIVLTPNTSDFNGNTQLWTDGSAIAICPKSQEEYPYDTRGIIQHEAGGHGFGKLGDEQVEHSAFITDCPICGNISNEIQNAQALGWFQNLSLTEKIHEVPWAHLIIHPQYSGVVDVFEGGYMHGKGVFRPELTSCMNNSIPYFNAISRESIVRRIKQYAGEKFSFEEFIEKDRSDVGRYHHVWGREEGTNQLSSSHRAPIIHHGKPMKSRY